MKTIVVIPDLQVPYHDRRLVATFQRFVKDFKPDELACVGDETDWPMISRWTRGMEGEYKGAIGRHRDASVAVLKGFRDVHAGPFHLSRSNHGDRPLNYLRKYAPGLMGLSELTVESLLRLDDMGITYHTKPYRIAPNTLLMHGDEGGMSQIAGQTARKLADRTGTNIVIGHTHRAGLIPVSKAHGGKVSAATWGLEVGHMMDFRSAAYLGGGIGNWQQGFAVLYVDGRNVTPVPVLVQPGGSFVVEGAKWTP